MASEMRLPGSAILGHGYDATGHYADPKSVTLPIYDLGQYDKTITAPNGKTYAIQSLLKERCTLVDMSQGSYRHISGESAETYRKSLSIQVGISGSYGLFSASVKTHYNQEELASFNRTFVTLYHHYDLWVLGLPDTSTLKMLPTAEADINGTNGMTPREVITKYGTHVLARAVIGGRARYSSFVDRSKYKSETSVEVAAEAAYKGALKLDATVDTKYKQAVESFMSSTETRFDTIGGDFKPEFDPERFVDWVASFKEHPVLVDFPERSLIEIYRLPMDQQRRDALKTAFEAYIDESQELVPDDLPVLEVMVYRHGTQVESDRGSGARENLVVYKPKLSAGWKWIGQTANQSDRFLIVKPLVPGAVVEPLGYERKWDDHGSGKKKCYSLWNIAAPPDYRALGGIARLYVGNQNEPSGSEVENLVCVHKSLCTEGTILGRIWCDAGTGATWDGSVWGIGAKDDGGIDTYTFFSQFSHLQPAATVYVIKKGPRVKIHES